MGELFKKYVLRDIAVGEVNDRLKRWHPTERFGTNKEGKLVPRSNGEPHYVEINATPKYLFDTAYLWDPKPCAKVLPGRRELMRQVSLHTYGAPSLFKPSLAEAVAQIPLRLRNREIEFEIDEPDGVLWGTYLMPDGTVWDNLREWAKATGKDEYEAHGESLHRASIRIYVRDERPEDLIDLEYGARIYPAVSTEDFLDEVRRHDAMDALYASIMLEAAHVPTGRDAYSLHVRGTVETLDQIRALETVKAVVLDLEDKPVWL